MRKFFFSISFLLLTILLVKNDAYTQTVRPLSFLEDGLSLINLNLESDNNDEEEKIQKDQEISKEFKRADSDSTSKSEKSPSSTRISIGIGKALFDKYIK